MEIDIHKIDTDGIHLMADFYDCERIGGSELLYELKTAIALSGANVIDHLEYDFHGTGFSAVFLLAESHFSIHIWPDEKYVSLDMYSCGKTYPQRTISYLERYFRPSFKTETTLNRGTRHTTHSLFQRLQLLSLPFNQTDS